MENLLFLNVSEGTSSSRDHPLLNVHREDLEEVQTDSIIEIR